MSEMTDIPLLETVNLTKHFRVGGFFSPHRLHAVDDLNLTINPREILAIVGESGSGKSTIARLLAKIYKPTAGDIYFRGKPITDIRSRAGLLAYRSEVPMILQDPFASLNPVHTIGYVLERGLILHRPELSALEREKEAIRVLEAVGLTPARQVLAKYPHEMSGGQRQRVGFAQALSYKPSLVLADEPVSMLDVSIRIGLLNLMARLCAEEGISFLYITHDIASARYVAHRIMVMYAGRAVEIGNSEDILQTPVHPYARLLLSAVPDPRAEITISAADVGEPPKVVNPEEGCRFRWRCSYALASCGQTTPALVKMNMHHAVACPVVIHDKFAAT